uniref:Platelet-derived growth factor (PDGF) family profile domain-containing protein n=1 Tax=Riptortus pedestris TaxID=329032 RepID=R4WE61_RIPPE|nr:hypothetical protein [Riptortus pedestris]
MYRLVVLCLAGIALADHLSNLDRLFNKLDGSTPPQQEELTTPGPPHRVRHGHLHHEIQQEYDEEDEDEDEDTQADNNSRSPYTTSLGRSDWKYLTSRKNLGKSWSTYHTGVSKGSDDDPKAQSEVRNHLLKMSKEFYCRVPQPKIVRVADHYPDRSGTYYPSCTKLHVCAEDTGCCGPTQKCGPKATHKVELYFYMTVDVPTIGRGSKTMRIEKLTFYNHTECACQDRTDEMPRDTDPRNALDTNKIPDQPLQYKCKCPSEYTVRNLANGSCTCDCFDKQRDCTKYKKGKENFNHHDRLCIEMGKCTLPSCDFGVFNRRLGRCPRKHEKFRSWARYKI